MKLYRDIQNPIFDTISKNPTSIFGKVDYRVPAELKTLIALFVLDGAGFGTPANGLKYPAVKKISRPPEKKF